MINRFPPHKPNGSHSFPPFLLPSASSSRRQKWPPPKRTFSLVPPTPPCSLSHSATATTTKNLIYPPASLYPTATRGKRSLGGSIPAIIAISVLFGILLLTLWCYCSPRMRRRKAARAAMVAETVPPETLEKQKTMWSPPPSGFGHPPDSRGSWGPQIRGKQARPDTDPYEYEVADYPSPPASAIARVSKWSEKVAYEASPPGTRPRARRCCGPG